MNCHRTGCICLLPARSRLGLGVEIRPPSGMKRAVLGQMNDNGFSFASCFDATDEFSAGPNSAGGDSLPRDSVEGQFPPALVQLAKRIKAIRESRSELLDASLFGEPAWNILLALYVAAGERYALSISALCAESGVPPTTAARSINRLLELDMVRRIPNPGDNRSCFVELTSETAGRMSELLGSARSRFLRD